VFEVGPSKRLSKNLPASTSPFCRREYLKRESCTMGNSKHYATKGTMSIYCPAWICSTRVLRRSGPELPLTGMMLRSERRNLPDRITDRSCFEAVIELASASSRSPRILLRSFPCLMLKEQTAIRQLRIPRRSLRDCLISSALSNEPRLILHYMLRSDTTYNLPVP
jgi:hypothetical protein